MNRNQYSKEYQELYDIAKKRYLSEDISLTKLAKELGIDRGCLSNNFKKDGISIINKQNQTKFNDTVFETIDTEEKAYWLGFLYADGYVGTTDNTIELSLKSSDIGHLKKFASFLEFDKSKSIFQDNVRCRLSFRNKKVKENLCKLGCIPQKSLVLTFPNQEQVPSKFITPFVRGYIDGDGSIMINTKRTGGRISILGTKNMLQGIVKYMGWKPNSIRQKDEENVAVIEWGATQDVKQYLKQLYQDATIYLDRKYNKYLEILAL